MWCLSSVMNYSGLMTLSFPPHSNRGNGFVRYKETQMFHSEPKVLPFLGHQSTRHG